MSRIVITGGSSGLGLAIKRELQNFNHQIWDFSYPDHDVRNLNDCKSFIAEICKNGGRRERHIDVLINCAGVSPLSWFENITGEEWDLIFNTNCKGVFNMCQAALPYLSAKEGYGQRHRPFDVSEGGTILTIISTAAYTPMTCSHAYNSSKAAVYMMMKQLARELKPRHDIDVIGLCPNKIAAEDSEMTRYVESVVPGLRGWTPEFAKEYEKKNLPAGRATPASSVAEFVAFILRDKDAHRYMSGSIIPYGA